MKLREYRKNKGLTLAEMGKLLAVDASTIWRYEIGKRRPSWLILQRILDVTSGDVQPADFFSAQDAAA